MTEEIELDLTVPQGEMEILERDYKADIEGLAGDKNL